MPTHSSIAGASTRRAGSDPVTSVDGEDDEVTRAGLLVLGDRRKLGYMWMPEGQSWIGPGGFGGH
ncbi:MAG: hypothetical protein ABW321_07580 [Polyangiales bacterium]